VSNGVHAIAISQRAYDLIAQYGKSHSMVIPDALIAATALVEGLPLVTHNDRHFKMISELSCKDLINLGELRKTTPDSWWMSRGV